MDKDEDGSDQPGDEDVILGPDKVRECFSRPEVDWIDEALQAAASAILPPCRAPRRG